MNKNKNSYFLFALTGLFFAAAIFMSACGNSGGSGNGATNGATANRANRNANAANNSQSQSAIPANAPAGASPAHYKGGASALVTIEEFADFQCPTCAVLHPTVQQIHAAYGDRVKIIFRNFPLQQIHPKAYDAAVAAEAAGLQGKFWEMQNELFRNQQLWANASDHRKLFEDYAQKIGLDANKFRDDVAGMAAKARVDADMARARTINVGSTPSFYVNGRLLSPDEMEFSKFRAVIDAEMQKAMAARQQQAPPAQTSAPQQTTTQTATAPIGANPSGANTSSASDGSANKTTGANK